MIPSSIYHVDINVTKLNITETGRITAPFHSVQQAIDDGYSHGFLNIEILVAAGFYPELITILPNMVIVVKGAISGICILNDIEFKAMGSFNPIIGLGTACSFNDVVIQNVTIDDADPNLPATNSVFITQNSSVVGNFIQTGRSVLSVFFAGIGTANAVMDGVVQSSQILGNVLLPHGNISATNTSFSNSILANQVYASGCDLAEQITASEGIELHQCIVDGDLICEKIYLDDISFNQVVTKNKITTSNPILLGTNNVSKLTEVEKDYQVLVSDQFIVIDGNTDPITLTLPEHLFLGWQLDIAVYNSSDKITILGNNSKINGSDYFDIINVYDHRKLVYIGKNRWIIK